MVVDDRVKIVKTSSKPEKTPPQKLPWPRFAPDDPDICLGIDVKDKIQDIKKIVHKYFRVAGIPMEELVQEIYVTIIHKNHTRSAHDPRKSSFSHYVYMISNNVCRNLVQKKKRSDREKESLDAPGLDDSRTLLDAIDTTERMMDISGCREDCLCDHMRNVEDILRRRGERDLARYIRAVRSGASPDTIREALSWGDHRVSNKTIRDFRMQIKSVLDVLHESTAA